MVYCFYFLVVVVVATINATLGTKHLKRVQQTKNPTKKRNSVNETVLKKYTHTVANSNNDCTCFLCRCERPLDSLIFAPQNTGLFCHNFLGRRRVHLSKYSESQLFIW